MAANSKDVKFIIYQVLYIFVVCVVALKGANLDLVEVLSKDKVVEKSYADSLKKYIDSLLALGLVPRIEIDTTVRSMAELQQKLEILRTQMASVSVSTTAPTIIPPEVRIEQEKKKEEEKLDIKEEPNVTPLVAQQLQQYRTNTIKNSGNLSLEIFADGSLIETIPPGGARSFTLMGQSSVTFKSGTQSKTVSTIPNKTQNVTVTRLVSSGEGVSLRQIQSVTTWRVTIDDDFTDQLEVKFSGPITMTQPGPNTYDIKLNFLQSKSQFDTYTENKDSPYAVSFTVSVTDKISKKNVSRQGNVQFSDW
jgi:hypothetical protein